MFFLPSTVCLYCFQWSTVYTHVHINIHSKCKIINWYWCVIKLDFCYFMSLYNIQHVNLVPWLLIILWTDTVVNRSISLLTEKENILVIALPLLGFLVTFTSKTSCSKVLEFSRSFRKRFHRRQLRKEEGRRL